MKILSGNLLEMGKNFDVIVHGCNCFCKMGAGIALQIKNKYPQAYKADLATESGDILKLGNITGAITGDFLILNAYTQYGFDNAKNTSYDAISKVFGTIAGKCQGKRIGYPMIGAGLGGGNWDIISSIIDIELAGMDHTLVVYGG